MEALTDVTKADKNKLNNSETVLLPLLDITIPNVSEVIRLAGNNENITWNGISYVAFPFSIDEITESSSGEVSEFGINVSNVNNVIGQYIRQYDAYVKNYGFEPITVDITIVNSNNLDSSDYEIRHSTTLIKPSLNNQSVQFKLGGVNAYNKTVHNTMLRNSCRFKFKSIQCGYTGSATECNLTFANCKTLENQLRFGGFPTISNRGVLL